MVKTRRMISQNLAKDGRNHPNKISKRKAKVYPKQIKKENQFASTEELLKLCRPFTICLTRCKLPDSPTKKVEGKTLG